jgi:hypothetical protein
LTRNIGEQPAQSTLDVVADILGKSAAVMVVAIMTQVISKISPHVAGILTTNVGASLQTEAQVASAQNSNLRQGSLNLGPSAPVHRPVCDLSNF